MTKLGEWLLGSSIFLAVYVAAITKSIKHQFVDDYYFQIQIMPVVIVALLGVSADVASYESLDDKTFISVLRIRHSSLQNADFQRMQRSR